MTPPQALPVGHADHPGVLQSDSVRPGRTAAGRPRDGNGAGRRPLGGRPSRSRAAHANHHGWWAWICPRRCCGRTRPRSCGRLSRTARSLDPPATASMPRTTSTCSRKSSTRSPSTPGMRPWWRCPIRDYLTGRQAPARDRRRGDPRDAHSPFRHQTRRPPRRPTTRGRPVRDRQIGHPRRCLIGPHPAKIRQRASHSPRPPGAGVRHSRH